ncbi:hypothetical protein ACIOYV_13830 [Pseudomonas sp. NPDC087342]|uniref:hypothetical protein n=1 Tax=Pseudomonas sp. NPDC087342 TaxID=3364437 RepID=UPI00382092DA
MREPVILANESLLRNGDFLEQFDDWVRGPVNRNWLSINVDWYEGERIPYLTAQKGASVSQDMKVPTALRAEACYFLSFLCETRHSEPGRMVVALLGSPDEQVILLPRGNARDPVADQARLDAGLPLDLIPTHYREELTLPLKKDDVIRVSVFSPANQPGDDSSQICITAIRIDVYLEPLVLQQLTLDDEVLPPDRVLYVCQGAVDIDAHRFDFIAQPGNPWGDTQAALTSDDNPDGRIVATPEWGVNKLPGQAWSLNCPVTVSDQPMSFSMSLVNQFTAEPYPVSVSFGHHRLVFRDLLEAAYFPVLERSQSVRLGVRVASYYTGQFLDGRTVNWTLEGQGVLGAVLTDEQGWAYWDFQPATAGLHSITASVESLYYAAGQITQTLTVKVLATDPWKGVLAVIEGSEAPWNEKTGYPNRGSDYPVRLKLPVDSPLCGTDLSLHWEGDSPDRFGVRVSPELEQWVPVVGVELEWILSCEDRLDGKFELVLGCSKLLHTSSGKPMSLARNLVKIGKVREANKSPIVDEQESVLLRVQVVHVLVSDNGDPVVNALVEWEGPNGTVSTVSGAGGWASVLDTPRQAGNYTVTARVRAHEHMQPVEHPFAVTAVATSQWKGQATFQLDNVEVDLAVVGVACQRGTSHVFRVTPTAGSPIQGKPMTLAFSAQEPGLGLTIGTPTATAAGGWEWPIRSVAGTSSSGLFEWLLSSTGLAQTRSLSGRLLSQDLADEARMVLDQISALIGGQTFYPCLGAHHRLNILPNALSPLVGLSARLKWSGISAGELNATVEPELTVAQVIDDGGARWNLDFTASDKRGQFALALELPQLNRSTEASAMDLGDHKLTITAMRESAVTPVVSQDSAWMWLQVFSAVTGKPVGQVPVTWTTGMTPAQRLTDAEGWSGFALAPTVAQPHEVEACVLSPYDDFVETRSMTVNVLPSDPWQDLRVKFDGQPAQPWGTRTYFPRRKGEHRIEVLVEQDSPLFDHDLTLGMTGTGPTALGLMFSNATLGVPRWFSSEGLVYDFKCDDLRDGSFALRLAATKLSRLSPANAFSLGVGSQVLKISFVGSALQTLDWGQVLYERVTVVSAISGRPVVGQTVTWNIPGQDVVESRTDFYGVAKLRFKPKTAGAGVLTAKVGDELYSESVSLTYQVNEPREVKSLTSASASGYPGEEVEAQVVIVSALTGQPLSAVEVMWEYEGARLAPTSTDAEGRAIVRFRLGEPGDTLLSVAVRGGEVGWDGASLLFRVDPAPAELARFSSITANKNPVDKFEWMRVTAKVESIRDQRPLQGITVFCSIDNGSEVQRVTNDQGEISLENSFLTPGDVYFSLRIQNYNGAVHGQYLLVVQ